nr:hypothetical protein [Nitrospirales bacterium]
MSHLIVNCQTSRVPSKKGFARGLYLFGTCSLMMFLTLSGVVLAQEGKNPQGSESSLAGERVINGIVEEIRGEQAKVDIGEGQPRYLPMNLREEKGLPALKKGDQVEITVNDQNLLVDVHLA